MGQHKRKKNNMSDVRIVDVIDLDVSNTNRSRRGTGEDHPDWALDYRTSDEEETDNEEQIQLLGQQNDNVSEEMMSNKCGSKSHVRVLMLTVVFVSLLFSVIAGAQYKYGTEGIKSMHPPMNMATDADVATAIESYGQDQFEKSVEQLDQHEMSNEQSSNMDWRKRRKLRGGDIYNDYT